MQTSEPEKPSFFQRLKPMLPAMAVGALIAVAVVLIGMRLYFSPEAQKAYRRVETGRDVMTLATLQEGYRGRTGTYANGFDVLARFSGDEAGLRERLGQHLDLQTLFVSGTKERFVIEANVLDPERTLIRYQSPPRKK